MVKRSGQAYAELADKTSVGGTVGALLALGLGPIPLQLGAEAYLYKQNLDGLTSTSGEPASQKDIQLSIGFGLPMSGGR